MELAKPERMTSKTKRNISKTTRKRPVTKEKAIVSKSEKVASIHYLKKVQARPALRTTTDTSHGVQVSLTLCCSYQLQSLWEKTLCGRQLRIHKCDLFAVKCQGHFTKCFKLNPICSVFRKTSSFSFRPPQVKTPLIKLFRVEHREKDLAKSHLLPLKSLRRNIINQVTHWWRFTNFSSEKFTFELRFYIWAFVFIRMFKGFRIN